MAYQSYERQFLSLFAAGSINAAGSTITTFGCGLTKIGTGTYALVLGADVGLVDDESYTWVTAKSAVGASGLPSVTFMVEDTNNQQKTIFVHAFPGGTVLADASLEIALYRSVTH